MILALAAIATFAIFALIYEKHQNGLREKEWSLERAALLQRIQAPERASAAQARREDDDDVPRVRVLPVSLDDDKAMTRAIGGDDAGS